MEEEQSPKAKFLENVTILKRRIRHSIEDERVLAQALKDIFSAKDELEEEERKESASKQLGNKNLSHDEQESWLLQIGRMAGMELTRWMDAFSETKYDLDPEETKTTLNVHKLRKYSFQCTKEGQPYLALTAWIKKIFLWERPRLTLAVFMVYMFCIWNELFLVVLLTLLLLQLAANYLKYRRKLLTNINWFPSQETDELNLDLAGAQLVVNITKKVQILLKIQAELLEKVKNLFLWERPYITFIFTFSVTSLLISTLWVKTSTIWSIFGYLIGIRLFVFYFIFDRYPRLQKQLDPIIWLLDGIPTEKQLGRGSKTGKKFSFSDAWQSFRESGDKFDYQTCILLDNNDRFPCKFASGWVFLTSSHFIFEYNRCKAGKRERLVLRYPDIIKIFTTTASFFFPGQNLEMFVHEKEASIKILSLENSEEFLEKLLLLGKECKAPFAIDQNFS